MRLATVQTHSGPKPAAFVGDAYVDLLATDPSLPPGVRQILPAGPGALAKAKQAAASPTAVKLTASGVKLLSPIPDPRKIICLGLNYRDHAAESGAPIPKEPILFSKYATALVGDGDNIVLPAVSSE